MSRANNKKNNNRKRPPIESYDVIATRTRRQKMANAAKWDIPIPIIIEIISWLNQEDLMNMSLVSKQSHGIIANEPGNKNKIVPVFEVSGTSIKKLFQNLKRHFMNKKTKKTLQSYRIMRFKDIKELDNYYQLFKMIENVKMGGITTLDLSYLPRRCATDKLTSLIPKILPNLREVDVSNTILPQWVFLRFHNHCPLLEKVTAHNNKPPTLLSGCDMYDFRYLKEVNMNNVTFITRSFAKMADLNNHQEIFIFHNCSRALERVSILNMTFNFNGPPDDINEDQKLIFTQHILIKFVRNVPSLRWLQSDLTQENIEMLRLERPEIELLN